MKRSIYLTLALTTALTLAGCGSKDESKATDTAASATATLPSDVQGVSDAIDTAAKSSTTVETSTIVSANGTAATTSSAQASDDSLVATGEFVSPVSSELAPKYPARVARMYVDEGSRVRKGQALLELDSEYMRLNLRSADAEIARAKAARDEAARDLERKKGLVAKDSIPRATLDRSQAVYDQTSAALMSASAQASLLRQQIADATLRSPVDGVIAEKRTEVGAKLGDGGVAFLVVQTSPLRLRFAVPERYLGKIKAGQQVTAHVDPYPNENFTGTIKTIGGVIDVKTRTMFAEAEFPNLDNRLRPGLFARVEADLK
jgi:membrane fusion protein (multidrug efflux system)